MIKEVTICDECGTQKRETNNWLVVGKYPLTHAFVALRAEVAVGVGAKLVDPRDICGEACAGKAFQKWLVERLQEV